MVQLNIELKPHFVKKSSRLKLGDISSYTTISSSIRTPLHGVSE